MSRRHGLRHFALLGLVPCLPELYLLPAVPAQRFLAFSRCPDASSLPRTACEAVDPLVDQAALCKLLDNAIRDHDEAASERCLTFAARSRIRVEAATFTPLIDKASKRGDLDRAAHWFAQARKLGVKLKNADLVAVITAAANQGNLSAAESWFARAEAEHVHADAATVTAVIKAAASAGNTSRAQHWYRFARSQRMHPNTVMHACLLHALRDDPDAVKHWFRDGIEQDGIVPNAVTSNIVIDAMARAGRMESASDYFRQHRSRYQPDAATFGSLINGAAVQGDVRIARYWLELMEGSGVAPTLVSWNALLKACGKMTPPGKDIAEELFYYMVRTRSLEPDSVTLITLIGFLGKARVKELCAALGVDYARIIRLQVNSRRAKSEALYARQSEQFRRLSRLTLHRATEKPAASRHSDGTSRRKAP
eukprot:TRINITY_DN29310_c0_g1_i2.p1 TRINITY_DN29310_c0_g1~~TRINITY_DN29310_c0_g1_i2.p1  ORF type:complete len:461 (-),score=98.71 TRINITY_DN29310_c0_g1_i2:82-1350(-)